MVAIDTDVILLAFAFHQDPRQPVNTAFLNRVQSAQPVITIFNLMEILGQLSFNLSPTRYDAGGISGPTLCITSATLRSRRRAASNLGYSDENQGFVSE